jgi:hypothetical protein
MTIQRIALAGCHRVGLHLLLTVSNLLAILIADHGKRFVRIAVRAWVLKGESSLSSSVSHARRASLVVGALGRGTRIAGRQRMFLVLPHCLSSRLPKTKQTRKVKA